MLPSLHKCVVWHPMEGQPSHPVVREYVGERRVTGRRRVVEGEPIRRVVCTREYILDENGNRIEVKTTEVQPPTAPLQRKEPTVVTKLQDPRAPKPSSRETGVWVRACHLSCIIDPPKQRYTSPD